MTQADRIRERKICEAVVRVLEKRLSAARSDGFSPEDPPYRSSDDERVEWVVRIKGSKFAIEVTLVIYDVRPASAEDEVCLVEIASFNESELVEVQWVQTARQSKYG
ncbi:MAG: hypothetical protein JOZ58_10290 [Acetobacteraceae bacterium]|nr:hypothetical protein [Acetobacteraceae bacterium]